MLDTDAFGGVQASATEAEFAVGAETPQSLQGGEESAESLFTEACLSRNSSIKGLTRLVGHRRLRPCMLFP